MPQLEYIEAIEKRLCSAADNLRANRRPQPLLHDRFDHVRLERQHPRAYIDPHRRN